MSDPTPPPWNATSGPGNPTPSGLPSAPGPALRWDPAHPDAGVLSRLQQDAVRTQMQVNGGRRGLRVVAVAAGVLWLVAVAVTFAGLWHTATASQFTNSVPNAGADLTSSSPDGWTLIQVLGSTLASTWGYALVAVLAFGASLWFDDSKARDLFELLDEPEDDVDVDHGTTPPQG